MSPGPINSELNPGTASNKMKKILEMQKSKFVEIQTESQNSIQGELLPLLLLQLWCFIRVGLVHVLALSSSSSSSFNSGGVYFFSSCGVLKGWPRPRPRPRPHPRPSIQGEGTSSSAAVVFYMGWPRTIENIS